MTSAAGLAYAGLHPVVALYATFVNRAFDQVLMDVALHRAGVTFVLDRAGVTGPDGPSHHGMWDLALLQVVPGIRIAAPRDAATLREELAEAVAVDDAPTVLRCPQGSVAADVRRRAPPARRRRRPARGRRRLPRRAARRRRGDGRHRLWRPPALLEAQGIGATVVDPRWVVPIAPSLVELSARAPPRRHASRTACGSAASAPGCARTCAPPTSTPA